MSKVDNCPYATPIPAKIWGVPFGVLHDVGVCRVPSAESGTVYSGMQLCICRILVYFLPISMVCLLLLETGCVFLTLICVITKTFGGVII